MTVNVVRWEDGSPKLVILGDLRRLMGDEWAAAVEKYGREGWVILFTNGIMQWHASVRGALLTTDMVALDYLGVE